MRAPLLRYGAAIIATISATILRMAMTPVIGAEAPFATYLVATLLVSWYFGFRAAVLTIVLSVTAGTYFFVSSSTTSPLFVATRADRLTVVGFVFLSLAVTFLLDLQRGTLERVQQEVIDRKTAENAEREQREWFETTLRSIGDAVIATDAEGKVIFMNSVATALTGWHMPEALGLPIGSVFHIVNERTGGEVESPVDIVIREGVTVGLANHTLLISKDGQQIPLDDSGAPIKREGRTLGAVLVFRDVTERRKTHRQIEESEHRYRLLFESNPQPMWVYDRESLAFLAVNHAAVQQYGYSVESFLAMTLKDIRPSEDIPALLEDVGKPTVTLHRDGPWRHRKRDGTIITVEIITHPIKFEGRSACLVLAADITERKKLEEQFHQAQRLDSVGRLAGGVAHDFNNLLTVINGYAAEIFSELPSASPLTHKVAEIGAAGQRAAALTQQLLAFTRRQPVQPMILNLNDVVIDVDRMLRRLIGEDIELAVRLLPDLGNIKADAGQLQQIVMNLVVNARDAMPNGGSLIIETDNVFLDESYCASHSEVLPGRYIMLAITDTGTGMTPEVQQRIFEPFFTTKPVGLGTGLGLASVHGMVRQSSGWIGVHSELGSGTSFKIYFPRIEEAVSRQQAVVESDVHGEETILVVEDQSEVRAFAVSALEHYGYQVLSASGGEEAIKLANSFQGPIHLLLTDMVMPGIHGQALAKQLAVGRTLRVLIMSGYTASTHAGVLDADMDYIQKPFTARSLAAKVRGILSRSKTRD